MNLKTLITLSILLIASATHAEIISKEIDYKQGDTIMKGMLAYDDNLKGKRPGVLIVQMVGPQQTRTRQSQIAGKRRLCCICSGYVW